ncbi:MAG: YqgE/AlgH family protein [Pseudomonadota bacterium]
MHDLTGKLLIAMPGMSDPRFERSVVFLCEHSEGGAMGLIVNKPTPEVDPQELLSQLGIEADLGADSLRVHFGGPVDHGRGFVLHSPDYGENSATLQVTKAVGMTATLDILEDIAVGKGPKQAILALGYSGWGPGQLETEFQANGWLVGDAEPEIVFHEDAEAKWTAALKAMGVDAVALSSDAGHA